MIKQILYILFVLGTGMLLFIISLGFFTVTMGFSSLTSLFCSIFILFLYNYFINLALEEG